MGGSAAGWQHVRCARSVKVFWYTVLQHLCAPPLLRSLIQQFYEDSWHVFACQRVNGQQWHRVSRGIVQGRPFSPLLAATIVFYWQRRAAGEMPRLR